MLEKKELTLEQLEKVTGGVRPEEIGGPIMLIQGIASYLVCEKCGACMFPKKVRTIYGNRYPTCPNYVCSECGATTQIITIN